MRKRRARRKAVGTRTPILVEAKVNARWSLDFVHDQLACGRPFRILNVVDDVTRECSSAFLARLQDTGDYATNLSATGLRAALLNGSPPRPVAQPAPKGVSTAEALSLPDEISVAGQKVEDWRREYNEVRPHSAIGDRTPMSLIQKPQQNAETPIRPEILT